MQSQFKHPGNFIAIDNNSPFY